MARRDLSTDPTNLKAMWSKAKKFYQELKRTGLSDIAISAILGNMAQESSFNPKAKAGSYSGYIQNQKEIVNWVIKHFGGYDHIHQMNYLIAGLTQKLPDKISQWGKELNKRFNTFLQGLTNNISVAQATKLWEASYEKSGGQELQKRINYANYFYNQIINENKQTNQPKKPAVKRKNKATAQQVPQINYPQEVLTMEQPQPEYTAQTDYTSNNLPLFFDFKNYQLDQEPVSQNAQQVTTEFDLPLFATNYKNGGKLIKRGQQGMKVVQTAPYNVEIYLEKDPISHPELQTYIPGLDPEERMDAVVQQLTPQYNPITNKVNQNNTYQPTVEQQNLKMIPRDDPAGDIMTGIITLPFGGTAIKYTPKLGQIIWRAIKQTMKNPKPFLKNLVYDTGTWIGLNEGTRAITGKTADQKLNWAMGFPEDEGPAFLLTGTTAGMGRRLVGKGVNLIGNSIKSYLNKNPEYYPQLELVNPNNIPTEELAQKLRIRIGQLKKEHPELNIEEISEEEIPAYLKYFDKNDFDARFEVKFKKQTPVIVGKINLQNNPIVQTAVNMLNYRIHNKMVPVEGVNLNKLSPKYLFGTKDGSAGDIIKVTTLKDYINQLGKTSSVISTVSSIDPSAAAISNNTAKTNLTQIGSGLFNDMKYIIKNFFHENVGHGLNRLLSKIRNPEFHSENMKEIYQYLIDSVDEQIIKTLDPERDLTVRELQATLLESLPEFLEKFSNTYNLTSEELLNKSITSPEWLDTTFDQFINKMDKTTFTQIITNNDSFYASVLKRLLPGSNGLAHKNKVFNFLPEPPEFSYERDVYDLVKTLKQQNTPYTDIQAENYMNTLKNIIGKGFSISALISATGNQNQNN